MFDLPEVHDPLVVLIGVPWEATTSYGKGTAGGPLAIAEASVQVDLFDIELGEPHDKGIVMLPIDEQLTAWSQEAAVIVGGSGSADTARVNALCAMMERHVAERVGAELDNGKLVGVIGGDHSVAYGSIAAHAARHPGMGILQFDAHADLRVAYQGYASSHASIMHRVMSELDIVKLVSVGVRDLCKEEHDVIRNNARIEAFFDADIRRALDHGVSFASLAAQIVEPLPAKVYVSFDIDGLDPSLCPNTGTPVPGGLSFNQALSVLSALIDSGRKIVGFDLVEVAPGDDEWDANVGARLLYKLIGYYRKSR